MARSNYSFEKRQKELEKKKKKEDKQKRKQEKKQVRPEEDTGEGSTLPVVVAEEEPERLLKRAAQHLCAKLRELLVSQRQVNLAVPGGRSVAKIFSEMLQEEVDWQRVQLFIVDERLVPLDHPESNFKLLREHLINPLVKAGRIVAENAHPFIFNSADPEESIREYERILGEHGLRYDVILLSAGEDGHVGALYPNHHSLADSHHGYILMDDSPKPPPERMTSSFALLQTAAVAVVLFVGEAKREAFKQFSNPEMPLNACPAKLVRAISDTTVFTDLA
ncbi:MAG: 6-phosphogluconolactonase [Desulforhopalus sp.]|nr:6-phosphogluconolactonase [Desulforhopalus sp.]